MYVIVTVPPKTLPAHPLTVQAVFMQAPRISRVTIKIERGHAYLTGLQMIAGRAYAVVIPEIGTPSTVIGGPWLTDDDRVIEKNVNIQFEPPHYEVIFNAYNQDDTYQHSFYIDLE